jgi:hypothetical protein
MAMTHEHLLLAQVDRHIAECEAHIARQREIIQDAVEQGHPADLAEGMLRAMEESLRAFERHRRVILERLQKKAAE